MQLPSGTPIHVTSHAPIFATKPFDRMQHRNLENEANCAARLVSCFKLPINFEEDGAFLLSRHQIIDA
jgi:hypothetical protein